MDILFNLIGLSGMALFLGAFLLLQQEKLRADDYPYLLMNLAGAVLIMASLVHDWNLPAFLLEVAWGAISLYGLIKRLRKDRATP